MNSKTASQTRSKIRKIAKDKVLFQKTNLTEEVDELVRKTAEQQRLHVKNFTLNSIPSTGDTK